MDVELIAHRGSSFLAPENTLAAAQLAWQEGADAVEGDFRITKDGHLVCIHDDSLKRTAGIDRRVADCTLDELRAYDVGGWKGERFAGQRIPTLEEMLATVPPGKRFFVEMKITGPEALKELCRVVEGSSIDQKQIVLISLRDGFISFVKQRLPQCLAYWVVQARRELTGIRRHWPSLDELLSAKGFGIDGLDLESVRPIDTRIVHDLKNAGLKLAVWTVDEVAMAQLWIDLGIHSITTNRPGWLRSQLRL
jgi:glycerophosphoryl diester phosphodiesterase